MEVNGERYALAALYLGSRPGNHITGDLVVPMAGQDGCGKSRPTDPRTIQLVASLCTD